MIRFSLVCDQDHSFVGWFSSSDDFDTQKKRGLIGCPMCDSLKIEKSLMAPQVSTSRKKEAQNIAMVDAARQEVVSEIRKLRDKLTENSDYVGEKFPEEARRIHYGETEERGIHGEAGKDDIEALLDEGINIAPLPTIPDDAN